MHVTHSAFYFFAPFIRFFYLSFYARHSALVSQSLRLANVSFEMLSVLRALFMHIDVALENTQSERSTCITSYSAHVSFIVQLFLVLLSISFSLFFFFGSLRLGLHAAHPANDSAD